MIIKKQNILFFIFFLVFLSHINANELNNSKISKGKQLTSPQMKLLNMLLEKSPEITVRVEIIKARAKQALYEILGSQKLENNIIRIRPEQEEQEFILKKTKDIFGPLNTLLGNIRPYKSIIIPIFAESLCLSTTNDKSSFLLKIFEIKDLEKAVTSISELEKICIELITVLDDIDSSISQLAKEKSEKLLEKMKFNKKADRK